MTPDLTYGIDAANGYDVEELKMNERIELTDTIAQVVQKLSQGNPGAVSVLCSMIREGETIDPDAATPIIAVLSLDDLGIRGPKIWMLFKDVCGCNLGHTIAVLRANQLGFLSKTALLNAIENYGAGIDVAGLCEKVKTRLPAFRLQESLTPAVVER